MELDKMIFFLKDHIRGISRIRSLGNSFQVDIVSSRISVVKAMILNGMDLVPLWPCPLVLEKQRCSSQALGRA
jgi:hypothetical protein